MYTYKVQIHPNNKQETRIRRTLIKTIEAHQIVYDIINNQLKENKGLINCYQLRKQFTNIKKQKDDEIIKLREGLTKREQRDKHLDTLFYDISNDALKQAIKDTHKSFLRFMKGISKYPVRKAFKDITKSFYVDPYKIKFTERKVKLEKISTSLKENRQVLNWISLAEKNRIPTNCKYYNPRVVYQNDRFYICVSVDDEYAPLKHKQKKEIVKNDNTIGIDLNLKEIVTSENKRYKQVTKTKNYKDKVKRLQRLQRKLSIKRYLNKNKISRNYIKLKRKLNKLHCRITNIRNDAHIKIIYEILKSPPKEIKIEDLQIKKMMRRDNNNSKVQKNASKKIHEASFSKFINLLSNECIKHNVILTRVPKYYPSTKMCSRCKNIKEMKLNDRVYICHKCMLEIDRDLNAAINIRNYA